MLSFHYYVAFRMLNGICPSPPTDDESDNENGEMIDIYYKTELIRLYLCLQQFTATSSGAITELSEEQDKELCALWDTINSSDVATFYLEHDMIDVLGLILVKGPVIQTRHTCLQL